MILLVLIPLPLFFARTVYSVQGLTVWVVIGIIWTFFSAFTVVVYPIFESRDAIFQICKGIVRVGFMIDSPSASDLSLNCRASRTRVPEGSTSKGSHLVDRGQPSLDRNTNQLS